MTPYIPQVSRYQNTRGRNDWTSLGYTQLIESVGPLTRAGVFQEGSLAAALAVARIIDRGRITRSAVTVEALEAALEHYREGSGWTPIAAIESALEQALITATEQELCKAAVAGSDA